jgi:uncharacterized membrane protein
VIQTIVRNFLRGLLFVTPVAVTAWVVWIVVATLDAWVEPMLGRRVPGAGLVLTLALITLVGVLAGAFATRELFRLMDRVFTHVPLVKLLYTSLRDLTEAFFGERRRFNRPVLVSMGTGGIGFIGFLTREDLAPVGLPDRVAVYFPQSYNFAGNLIVVPRASITPLDLDPTTAMTLIVSGGVAGLEPVPARAVAEP